LEIDGYLKALKDLFVEGKADFKGRTIMHKSLAVSDSTIVNNLFSSGPMTLNSTLISNGDVEFNGSLLDVKSLNSKFINNVTISGDTDLQGISVAKDAGITGKLNVTGDTNLQAISVAKDAGITGKLTVSGDTDLQGISVAENASITGKLNVTGDTDLQGISVTKDAGITGKLTVSGDTDLQGISVAEDAGITGKLTVSGDTDLNGISVAKDARITGKLKVGGNSDLQRISVAEDADITGKLNVIGETSMRELSLISDNNNSNPVLEITTKKKGIEIKMAKKGRIDKSHTYIEFTSSDGKLGEIRASLVEELLKKPLELWEYYNLVQKEKDKIKELTDLVENGIEPVKVVGYEEALAKMVSTFTGKDPVPVVGPALPFGGGELRIAPDDGNGTFSAEIIQSGEQTYEINEGVVIEATGTTTGTLEVNGEGTGETTVVSDVVGGGVGPIEGVAEGFGVSAVEGVAEVVIEGEATGEGIVNTDVTGEASGELTVNVEKGEFSGSIAIAELKSSISAVNITYPFKLTELNNAYVPNNSRYSKAAKEVSEASAKLLNYVEEKLKDGVVYESGNADYAEWIPKKKWEWNVFTWWHCIS